MKNLLFTLILFAFALVANAFVDAPPPDYQDKIECQIDADFSIDVEEQISLHVDVGKDQKVVKDFIKPSLIDLANRGSSVFRTIQASEQHTANALYSYWSPPNKIYLT